MVIQIMTRNISSTREIVTWCHVTPRGQTRDPVIFYALHDDSDYDGAMGQISRSIERISSYIKKNSSWFS